MQPSRMVRSTLALLLSLAVSTVSGQQAEVVRGTTAPGGPLRFTPVFQFGSDRLSSAQREILQQHAVPIAQAWLAQTLSLRYPTTGSLRLERQCSDWRDVNDVSASLPAWLSTAGSLCFEYAPPTCHHASIPEAHLAPAALCTTKSSEDCTALPSGDGLDTHFVVYFTAEPSSACATPTRGGAEGPRAAHGAFCPGQRAFMDRPTAANINVCAEGFPSEAHRRDEAVLIVLRELLAGLAMDSELVLWYKTAHGQPRVVKQPDGSILTDDLKSVLTVRYFQAQRLLYTTLPTVVSHAARHFGCPELSKLELERADLDVNPSGMRWEARKAEGELMAGAGSPKLGDVVSNLTLALLEDSGWYVPDYSRAGPLVYGAGQGCAFATALPCSSNGVAATVIPSTMQCVDPPDIVWSPTRGVFTGEDASLATGNYQQVGQYSCSPTLESVAQCSSAPDMDTCRPALRANLLGACTVATLDGRLSPAEVMQRRAEEEQGGAFGATAACLPSTLWGRTTGEGATVEQRAWLPRGAACYNVSCNPLGHLFVHFDDGSFKRCPQGETIKLDELGFQGEIGPCPHPTLICARGNCLDGSNGLPCSGVGACGEDGVCRCDPGYTGPACEEAECAFDEHCDEREFCNFERRVCEPRDSPPPVPPSPPSPPPPPPPAPPSPPPPPPPTAYVSSEIVYDTITGRVGPGWYSGCEVVMDVNGDGVAASNEATATTFEGGRFVVQHDTMVMRPGTLRGPDYAQRSRSLRVKPSSRCVDNGNGLPLFAPMYNRSPRLPRAFPEDADDATVAALTSQTAQSATLDVLAQLVTATAEATLPDGGLGVLIDLSTWSQSEQMVKDALLGMSVSLPVNVLGYRVMWSDFRAGLRIGTDDVISAAMEGDPMALRAFAIMCKLHVTLVHAASLTGAYEGGTDQAATGFRSAVRGVSQLMIGSRPIGSSNDTAESTVSNDTTIDDPTESAASPVDWTSTLNTVSEVHRVFEATRLASMGAFASSEMMAAAAVLTSQLAGRIDGLAIGFGNPLRFDFLATLSAQEHAAAEAKLRVAAILGLVAHAESDILVLLAEGMQGRMEPSETLVFVNKADMGRAINARISAIANAMGLSDFQALSVLNCPAGGCSVAVSEGGDSGDGGESGGGDYKWAIGLAVGVVFVVSAGIALYCFKTRWKRRANRIDVERTERKETVDVEYEAGEKSGVGPGDATSLGERQTHQRHIVVGLPIGLPEMGNNDIDDIYNKPLREVYKESTAKAGGREEHVGVFQNYPGSAPSASQRPGSEDVVLFDLDGGQDDSTTTPQMSPLSPPPITASIEEEEEVEPRIPELEEYEELRPSRPHAQPGHATARSKQDLVRVPASSRTAAAKSGLRVDNSGFVLRPHPTSGRVERKPSLAPL